MAVVKMCNWKMEFVNVSKCKFVQECGLNYSLMVFWNYCVVLLLSIFMTACFGSWGINCTQNCTPGYYGFGCRSRCLCHPYQLCDKIFVCRDNISKGPLLILYNFFILCYLKSTKHAIQIRIFSMNHTWNRTLKAKNF